MDQIYIYGAGGLGKEVYGLIQDINQVNNTYEIIGFVDANPAKKIVSIGNKTVPVFAELSFVKEFSYKENINLVIAIGDPNALCRVARYFKENTNFIFPNLLHPSIYYNDYAFEMNEGNIIMANTYVSLDVHLNSFNIINLHCTIGHDTRINSFNVINPGVNLSGGVKIGDQNLFGTNATITQYLNIGDRNSFSAASFISKNIENNQILIGNPARVIGLNNYK